MHTHTFALYTSLMALGLAKIPPFPSPPGGETQYLSKFDDLVPTTPVLSLQNVGPYNGLDFQLRLIETGVDGAVVLGVKPASKPNVAAYDLTNPDPKMTTQYDGSVTDTFDFASFFAGCVVDTQETALSVVTSCKITVQGYRATELVAKQTFAYDSFGAVAVEAPMEQFTLSQDFQKLDTVTFQTDYLVTALLGATLLDNVQYTVHYIPASEAGGADGEGSGYGEGTPYGDGSSYGEQTA